MTNHSTPHQRHGKGQSRSRRISGRRKSTQKQKDHVLDVDATSFRRLERAKRNIKLFNKISLCVASLCLGNSIYTKLTNTSDRHSGWNFVWGEAFHGMQSFHWEKRSIARMEPLDGNRVPKELIQSFGVYPNIFNITAQMRSEFHPVVKFPLRKVESDVGECVDSATQRRKLWPWQNKKHRIKRQSDEMIYRSCVASGRKMNETYDFIVQDFTQNSNHDKALLLEGGERVPQLLATREEALKYSLSSKLSKQFDVGRYDEDRRGMYTSPLFVKDGTSTERRTVHVGIDIGAPVGTVIYAFEDGRIHSAGYNPDVGDYGHVVVVEHVLKNHEGNRVYALYGHLSAKSIKGKYPGQKIRRGKVIGFVGNTAENGGWTGKLSCSYLNLILMCGD
jgi:murein DD-endopeptidase MepM/ murein hydrolase activator NlpD